MPKIRMYVNTGYSGANHEDFMEIDDSVWNLMTDGDRQKYLDELASDFMGNCIDYGAHVVEG